MGAVEHGPGSFPIPPTSKQDSSNLLQSTQQIKATIPNISRIDNLQTQISFNQDNGQHQLPTLESQHTSFNNSSVENKNQKIHNIEENEQDEEIIKEFKRTIENSITGFKVHRAKELQQCKRYETQIEQLIKENTAKAQEASQNQAIITQMQSACSEYVQRINQIQKENSTRLEQEIAKNQQKQCKESLSRDTQNQSSVQNMQFTCAEFLQRINQLQLENKANLEQEIAKNQQKQDIIDDLNLKIKDYQNQSSIHHLQYTCSEFLQRINQLQKENDARLEQEIAKTEQKQREIEELNMKIESFQNQSAVHHLQNTCSEFLQRINQLQLENKANLEQEIAKTQQRQCIIDELNLKIEALQNTSSIHYLQNTCSEFLQRINQLQKESDARLQQEIEKTHQKQDIIDELQMKIDASQNQSSAQHLQNTCFEFLQRINQLQNENKVRLEQEIAKTQQKQCIIDQLNSKMDVPQSAIQHMQFTCSEFLQRINQLQKECKEKLEEEIQKTQQKQRIIDELSLKIGTDDKLLKLGKSTNSESEIHKKLFLAHSYLLPKLMNDGEFFDICVQETLLEYNGSSQEEKDDLKLHKEEYIYKKISQA